MPDLIVTIVARPSVLLRPKDLRHEWFLRFYGFMGTPPGFLPLDSIRDILTDLNALSPSTPPCDRIRLFLTFNP